MNATDSDDDRLAHEVAALPRELRPPHDGWPTIAARVRARRRRPVWVGGSIAAAVVAAALLLQSGGRPPATEPATLAVDTAVRDGLDTLLEGRVDLSSMTVAMLRANVALFDRALQDITSALVIDPSNPVLQRQLHETYRGQLELLDTLRRAPRGT